MLCASATESIYGEIIWNPVTALDMILTDSYDSKHRAGAFFIAAGELSSTRLSAGRLRLTPLLRPAGFVYCLLFSCVAENMYPFANDSASLLPKVGSSEFGFLCPRSFASFLHAVHFDQEGHVHLLGPHLRCVPVVPPRKRQHLQ